MFSTIGGGSYLKWEGLEVQQRKGFLLRCNQVCLGPLSLTVCWHQFLCQQCKRVCLLSSIWMDCNCLYPQFIDNSNYPVSGPVCQLDSDEGFSAVIFKIKSKLFHSIHQIYHIKGESDAVCVENVFNQFDTWRQCQCSQACDQQVIFTNMAKKG